MGRTASRHFPLRLLPLLLTLAGVALIPAPALSAGTASPGRGSRAPGGVPARRIVRIAEAQLALHPREGRPGSDESPDIDRYRRAAPRSAPGSPWSAAFASWVARQAGAPVGASGGGVATPAELRGWARQTGRWRRSAAPGELIVQDHHAGIVERVYRHGALVSIEGSVGGAVRRRAHRASDALGYVVIAAPGRFALATGHPSEAAGRQPLAPRISLTPEASATAPASVNQVVTFTSEDSSGPVGGARWSFGDGSRAVRGPTVSHAFPAAGAYTVTLSLGPSRAARMTRRVVVASGGPHAVLRLSPTAATVGQAVRAYATASTDQDATITSFAWDAGNGTTVTGSALPVFTYARPGVYTVTLRVTDDAGRSDQATGRVTVRALRAPALTLSCARTSIAVHRRVSCSVAATAGDAAISSYAWDDGQGGGAHGGSRSFTATYDHGGVFMVRALVTDADGVTAESDVPITVIDQPPAIALNASTVTGPTGTALAFDARGTRDPDGRIASYAWDFGDGTTSSRRTTTHAYARAGAYVVTLTATDDGGVKSTARILATVTDRPPVAALSLTGTQAHGSVLTFDAGASTDPDGQVVSYAWDFGDGTRATGSRVAHTYATAGSYTATVTVTDDSASTAQAQRTVAVS